MKPVDRITLLVNYLTSPKAKKAPSIATNSLSQIEVEDIEDLPETFFTETTTLDQKQIQPSFKEESLNVVSASNELVKLLAKYPTEPFEDESETIDEVIAVAIEDLRDLIKEGKIEEWRLLRAGMIATVYGRSVDPDVRKEFRTKFMSLARHDEIPVNRKRFPYENKVEFRSE